MRDHGILVIRGQDHIGDDEHIRFSEAFGPLELPPSFGRRPERFRPELYDASTLDETGEIAPADSLRHKFAEGNELFHSDSSFNLKPAKWSLLFGHIITLARADRVRRRTRCLCGPAGPHERAAGRHDGRT